MNFCFRKWPHQTQEKMFDFRYNVSSLPHTDANPGCCMLWKHGLNRASWATPSTENINVSTSATLKGQGVFETDVVLYTGLHVLSKISFIQSSQRFLKF